jgi:hypothetical protein
MNTLKEFGKSLRAFNQLKLKRGREETLMSAGWQPEGAYSMEKEQICKNECDMAVRECEGGSISTEECENRWDRCMSDCMSECEIYP